MEIKSCFGSSLYMGQYGNDRVNYDAHTAPISRSATQDGLNLRIVRCVNAVNLSKVIKCKEKKLLVNT